MRLSQRWRTRISTLWYDLRVRHFNLAVLCSISNISYARYIVYFYSRFVIDHKQRKTDICAAYLCQKLDSYCFFYENVLSIYFNYVFIQSYKWFYLRRFILIVKYLIVHKWPQPFSSLACCNSKKTGLGCPKH